MLAGQVNKVGELPMDDDGFHRDPCRLARQVNESHVTSKLALLPDELNGTNLDPDEQRRTWCGSGFSPGGTAGCSQGREPLVSGQDTATAPEGRREF